MKKEGPVANSQAPRVQNRERRTKGSRVRSPWVRGAHGMANKKRGGQGSGDQGARVALFTPVGAAAHGTTNKSM